MYGPSTGAGSSSSSMGDRGGGGGMGDRGGPPKERHMTVSTLQFLTLLFRVDFLFHPFLSIHLPPLPLSSHVVKWPPVRVVNHL